MKIKLNKNHIEWLLKSQLNLDKFKVSKERSDYDESVLFLQRGLEGILTDYAKQTKEDK